MAAPAAALPREDAEVRDYRELLATPDTFEDGFNWKTVIGAFFIGFVMMPGSIYLGLVAGATMGPAAEWVTIILFSEVARRSFVQLKRQEIYMLYYIAGSLVSSVGVAMSGGPFAHLMWRQYLAQSPAMAGLAEKFPQWAVPPATSEAIVGRSLLHPDWRYPILILLATHVLGRLNWFGLGYLLFRVTSDIERLPFPLAPVAAMGATALAESHDQSQSWRWRVFSIGAMIGLAFGVIYIGLPTLSGMILIRPIALLPIPWIDFTHSTEAFLPAAPTGIGTSLASVLTGFVMPFWAVVGSAIAAAATVFLNPVMQRAGWLPTWQPGSDTITTSFTNYLDFWLSFSIGSALAVAAIGVTQVIISLRERLRQHKAGEAVFATPEGRGDVPFSVAAAAFVVSTLGYVLLGKQLVPAFPLAFLLFYGFLWTPLTSYIDARLRGLTGQFVEVPFIREATFAYSVNMGYRGVAIWFAPIPIANYGYAAQNFRELELTGTKITSLLKAELLMLPILFVCSFIFWAYIWSLGSIPSVNYPYAEKMWQLIAMRSALWYSATSGDPYYQQLFLSALKWKVIGGGFVFGTGTFGLLKVTGWPVALIYGYIRGMGELPHNIVLEFAGALLGRYYFAKRFGVTQWKNYAPILLAGFACGMGLISMVAIAMALISQSVRQLPF